MGAIHDSRYSWGRLALTLAIAMVGNIGMWSVIVVMPAVRAEFGIDRASASLPYSATILGMALGDWMSGWIYDLTGSYTLAFVNGIAWNALNIVLVLFIASRRERLNFAPISGKAAAYPDPRPP